MGLRASEIRLGPDLIGPQELNLTQPRGFKFSPEAVPFDSALARAITAGIAGGRLSIPLSIG